MNQSAGTPKLMDHILILIIALALDLTLGDPPTRFHPVGWMGKSISLMERLAPRHGETIPLLYGMTMLIVGTAAFTAGAFFLLDYLAEISRIAFIAVGALMLKSMISLKGLHRAALAVKDDLTSRNLDEARGRMPALVSRDPKQLDEPMLIAATVESVAENTSDSFVAPLFWFLIFGVPGAVAYRMVNTFDSMIGYRGKYEYLGKFAARLDDILNLIPARLTGLMMVAAAGITRKNARGAWSILLRDHYRTASPNAGWPMSAAAGALGIRLEKAGHYQLGDPQRSISMAAISDVIRLTLVVAAIWSLVCLGIEGVRFALET